jgi:hypothetical protein
MEKSTLWLNRIAVFIHSSLSLFNILYLCFESDKNEYFLIEIDSHITEKTLFTSDASMLVYALLTFSTITAGFHCLYLYQDDIPNYNRWIEYSITATIMLVIIAITSGVKYVEEIIAISIFCVVMIILGGKEERLLYAQQSVDIILHTISWLLLLCAYGIIFIRYTQVVLESTRSPPWFVHVIVFVMFLCYSSFGVIQLYHIKTEHVNIENYYIIASIVSKSILTVLLLSGLLMR